MRVFITGAAGKLGAELTRQLMKKHEVIGADIAGGTGHRLDVTDYAACQRLIHETAPDIVLHPAAWTDVDACARHPRKALRINGVGAHNVAACAAQIGIPILYVSSNEVFDGRQNQPYTEYDSGSPINPYGYSKWYGERAVSQSNPRHYIVRTAWLFGAGRPNFVQAILKAAKAGKTLRVVTDEVANPTYVKDVASAIADLIETARYGSYHFVNEGAASRWDLARYVLDRTGFANTPIERISRHEWPRPSLPPQYTALANIAGAGIGIRLRPWQESAREFLQAEAAS